MVEMAGYIAVADLISEVTVDITSGNREHLRSVRNVCVDSRKCTVGSLFVPLHGERTDGHFYIEEALINGSTLCFVGRQYYVKHQQQFSDFSERFGALFLVVADSLTALQQLAKEHMRQRSDLFVIGISGSNGKTTTKEILGSILSQYDSTVINPGNLNSDIGLPLAVFEIEDHHRYAVFELGINRPAEMDILVDIVRPKMAAITNIGKAHIGPLGSRKAIAGEKSKIFRYLTPEYAGYIYENDYFRDVLEKFDGEIRTFGPSSTPHFQGSEDLGLSGSLLRWKGYAIPFPLIGAYNILNALCAISLALDLGVPDEAIVAGLESVKPLFGRGMVLAGDVTVIQDCYNANTDSMFKAIEFVDSLSWTGRKILILGSMKELGTDTHNEHRLVGFRAADSSADMVFFFGEESAAAYDAAQTGGGGAGKIDFYLITSFDELEETVARIARKGDLVLLKGSRSIGLERLTDTLLNLR